MWWSIVDTSGATPSIMHGLAFDTSFTAVYGATFNLVTACTDGKNLYFLLNTTPKSIQYPLLV